VVTSDPLSLEHAQDFARMATELLAEQQERPTIDRIARLAAQTVDACDFCAVTLRSAHRNVEVAASTDPVAVELVALQQQLGEGPALDIASDLGSVSIEDLSTDGRWPKWADGAVALGAGSMLGIYLDAVGHNQIASLNLFALRPHAFNADDLAVADVFARLSASALDVAHTAEGLRAAARSRQVIGVAEGMLMQRFGLTLDQAFELLRRYSRDHNVKLRVLAERLANAGKIPTVGDATEGLEEALGLSDPAAADQAPTIPTG